MIKSQLKFIINMHDNLYFIYMKYFNLLTRKFNTYI